MGESCECVRRHHSGYETTISKITWKDRQFFLKLNYQNHQNFSPATTLRTLTPTRWFNMKCASSGLYYSSVVWSEWNSSLICCHSDPTSLARSFLCPAWDAPSPSAACIASRVFPGAGFYSNHAVSWNDVLHLC
ncbi:hypothetical protein Y1Q_0023393 [Alligator mississippiensis]|uniref:Uncharacterized protein n=1 Tax=Alligator mississippiensis TaxID=8496 RepID=A0A151NPH3_ALLMI|nr:hypothetical protein Y1Q_0023393 [Alligator mississippiensis]